MVSLSHDGNGGLWEDDVSCLISLVTGTWHHIESVLKGQMWNDQVFGRREGRQRTERRHEQQRGTLDTVLWHSEDQSFL